MASAGRSSSAWSTATAWRQLPPRTRSRRPRRLRPRLDAGRVGLCLALGLAGVGVEHPRLAHAEPLGAGGRQTRQLGQLAQRPAASLTSDGAHNVEIRLSLSEVAARSLFEPRVRRLVEIETSTFAVLAPGAAGPLGDGVADVWVAQPTPAKVVVEVRVGVRPIDRREIAVRGLAGDVAARLVSLAIADMVRAGIAPRQMEPPPPVLRAERTLEEIERAYRVAPAMVVNGGVEVAALPGSAGAVAGPALSFALRRFGLSEALVGRWLEGPIAGTSMRWLELGLAVDYRFWITSSFRMTIGGSGGFSSVHLADVGSLEGQPGEHDAWSARAGAKVAFELRVARPVWLSLDLLPGAILRPVHFTDTTSPRTSPGAQGTLGGAWLGIGLGAHFEIVSTPDR